MGKTDSQSVIYQTLKKDFQQFQKTLKSTIRMAKKMYFYRSFNLYKGDIKKTWLIINKTLSNKKTSDLSQSFRIGNKLISDPNEIANEFNKYFINIGKQISNQIVPTQSFQSYLTSPTNKRFKLMEVNDNEIIHIVNNLKNKSSYGYDCISNLLLKRAKNELIKPLTLIINQTINTGIFPEQLKISQVKPLFKKGDSTLFFNYRPISLLPSISIIFEYVIFKQLITYLNTNNLLCPQQFGFRPAHSTELAGYEK